MKLNSSQAVLLAIFILVFSTRLYLAFSTPHFSTDSAYFHVRQINQITETGTPLFYDPLSYSGRDIIFSPVFHYIISFFSLIMPVTVAAKLIPNLFASFTVIFVYLISKKITNNINISLFTAFLSGFIPVFFSQTLNSASPLSLAMPLIFILIYAFMNIDEKKWLYTYLVSLILLSFISPLIILFILGLFIYLFLIILENIRLKNSELEIAIFSIFFVFWSQFIIYKKLFQFHGLSVIWRNIPKEIFAEHFFNITIVNAIYLIGIIPFVLGIYIIFRYLFKEKKQDIYLLIGFVSSAGILLWLKLIELNIGMMFFGIALVLLYAQWHKLFIRYIRRTRAANLLPFFSVLIFALFIIASVIPSFTIAKSVIEKSIPTDEINALKWLRQKSNPNTVIVASFSEGNLITAVAKRRNIIDSNFLLQEDTEERFNDIKKIFTTRLEIEAVRLMEKYNADYIYFSPKSMQNYQVHFLSYVSTGRCFQQVYGNDLVKIYRKMDICKLKVVK